MRANKFLSLIGLPAALLLFTATPAQADRPGIYLGGSWGGYRVNESNLDDNDDLVKAFAGLQFNQWFGIEGQWTDFSRVDNGTNNRFDGDGKGLSAVLSFPLSETTSLFVKGGQFWWDANSALGGVVGSPDGNDPFFGGGVKLGFNKSLALRLEYERYDVANIKFDTVSAGLQFTF